MPIDDITPGMRADRRVGDHPFGGAIPCHRVEALRIEAKQQNLVEPRPVAHRIVGRIEGQAIASFPLDGTSSGFNGSGVALSTATKRSPSRGRSRLVSVCAPTTCGARTRPRPSSMAVRRRIRQTCQRASRFSGLIGVVPSSLPRIWRGLLDCELLKPLV